MKRMILTNRGLPLLMFFVLQLASNYVIAQGVNKWQGRGAGPGNRNTSFTQNNNWSQGSAPDANDDVEITINNTDGSNLNFDFGSLTNFTVNSLTIRIEVAKPVTFDVGSRTFTVKNASVFEIPNNIVVTLTLGSTSTGSINFQGNTTFGNTAFGSIYLVGSSASPSPNTFTFQGNVAIGQNVKAPLSGSVAANATFAETSAQTVTQTSGSTFNFRNLTIDKTGGTVTLNSPLAVDSLLTFTRGIVNTTGTNVLTLNPGATVSGASNNSFVNGPVRKTGTTAFTFPVGKGSRYVPIAISVPTASSTFQAEYFTPNPNAGATKTPPLQTVSACEYWDLQRIGSGGSAQVTLSWNSNNACSGPSYISDPSTIVVAQLTGTTWTSVGGTGTGNTGSGSVTSSSAASTFGNFTLGSTSTNNALPVLFGDVNAAERAGSVEVSFANLTEASVAAYYIERSTNGTNFQSIASLPAKANNGGKAIYKYIDEAPLDGENFYRIRAVETTGKVMYSKDVSVDLKPGKADLILYPNPADKSAPGITLKMKSLPAGAYQLRVYNQNGQLVHSSQVNHGGGAGSSVLPLRNLATGRYILQLDGAVKFVKSFLVQ